MHFEHSGYRKVINSTDIKKLILQPFRSVKIDTVSYSSHQNPTRTRWDWVREKKSPFFFICGCASLLSTLKQFIKASGSLPKNRKTFFQLNILKLLNAQSSWNFFSRSGLCSTSWDFFFKMIEQKLKKFERSIPPPKTPVLGGSDGLATENSGNVVGG